jgi:hypothetical protein
MIALNLHCHSRTVELDLVLQSIIKQKINKKITLNIIIDPKDSIIKMQILKVISKYKQRLSCSFDLAIYTYKKNVGLAASILNALEAFSNQADVIIVLEDDIQLKFDTVLQDVIDIFEGNFKGHVNMWQPVGSNDCSTINTGQHMWCWGWAADIGTINEFLSTKDLTLNTKNLFQLSRWGLDFLNHLVVNLQDKKKTWAIFYYIFLMKSNSKIYNFPGTLTAEISNNGTNRKQNIFFNITKNINNIFLLSLSWFYMKPNIRYEASFFMNVLAVPRLARSMWQIIAHRNSFEQMTINFTKYEMEIIE